MLARLFRVLFGAVASGVWAAEAERAPIPPVAPAGWIRLAPLPDPEGFASAYAGVSHDALIVAGGANFPDKKPWDGGTKVWTDRVFVLTSPEGSWIEASRLPTSLAYGVSTTTPAGILCVGGSTDREHVRDTFLLRWDGQRVLHLALPHLPQPCAFAAGALVGSMFYLVGGIATPTATEALASLWALDLDRLDEGWRKLDPCPGPGRMLPVAGSSNGTFFVFGGVSLSAGPDGKALREPRRDAYAYTHGHGWRRIADLPRAATAAPSPAPVTTAGELLVISGDDGERGHLNGPNHPGFPTSILVYDPRRDAWRSLSHAPFSRATAPTAPWRADTIIASGERKPGYRSNEIWRVSPDRVVQP